MIKLEQMLAYNNIFKAKFILMNTYMFHTCVLVKLLYVKNKSVCL